MSPLQYTVRILTHKSENTVGHSRKLLFCQVLDKEI